MNFQGQEAAPHCLANVPLDIGDKHVAGVKGIIAWKTVNGEEQPIFFSGLHGWLEIDSKQTPHAITVGPDPRLHSLLLTFPQEGIFKLDGDTLTICFGKTRERPKSFDEKEARFIGVYKRDNPATKQ